MSTQNTFAPWRAIATAVALPLPQPGPLEPAPTIIATLSFKRLATGLLLFLDAFLGVQLAEIGLLYLSVIVLRQRVEEHVVLRPFEARDFGEAQRVELSGTDVTDHVGDHDLAPLGMRAPDDGRFAHGGVAQQHLFHLARIDVRATRNDQILGAVFQRQIAIRVEHPDIASMQPAAAHGHGIGVRVTPVTRHHDISAAEDFAGLADTE